jgi:hypothetical protein
MCKYICICIYIYTHTHTHTHTCIYIYIIKDLLDLIYLVCDVISDKRHSLLVLALLELLVVRGWHQRTVGILIVVPRKVPVLHKALLRLY